jgi:N-methylhydantoinase A
MRYRGQAFELDVPLLTQVDALPDIDASMLAAAAAAFHRLHERRYGHALHDRPLEVVQLHHTMANAATALPTTPLRARHSPLSADAHVVAYPDDATTAVMTALYTRDTLTVGDRIVGPAVITQLDATTVIPSEWHAEVSAVGSLVITRMPAHP